MFRKLGQSSKGVEWFVELWEYNTKMQFGFELNWGEFAILKHYLKCFQNVWGDQDKKEDKLPRVDWSKEAYALFMREYFGLDFFDLGNQEIKFLFPDGKVRGCRIWNGAGWNTRV
jgi:hypothetical protein